MNPQGISVFYGAMEKETAIAEIRPPVGSRAVVGRFNIIRDIKLLDVEALGGVYALGSVFDPSYIELLERAEFLTHLSERISKPVMPDDEPFEYLATQAIAEYLSEKVEPRLDGMVFRSVQRQNSSRNVILFHHASSLVPQVISNGADISVSEGYGPPDDPMINYSVSEAIPSEPKEEPVNESLSFFSETDVTDNPNIDTDDTRVNTLQLEMSEVFVYHLNGITFDSSEYKVTRHTYKKEDTDLF
jgi:RES domain